MAANSGHGSYAHGARRCLLRLGGVDCGFVAAIGGGAYAEVVDEQSAAGNFVGKHLSAVRYEDIVLACAEPPGKTLTDWIELTLAGQQTRHDGEIVELDVNDRERSRRSFRNALIDEITFPALDAGTRGAVQLSLRLAPESTRRTAPSGPGAKSVFVSAKQKLWQSDSFRLTIDDLDCKKVIRIEQLVARQAAAVSVGETRDYQSVPTPLDIPDLVVTLDEASAAGWFAWLDDFVVMGRGTQKNGKLELLSPGGQTPLATLTLSGLGIYRLAENTFAAARDTIARVQATMYCERFTFDVHGATDLQPAATPLAAPPATPPGTPPPSRADVIAPLGDSLSPRLTARRELLGQMRAR